MTFLNWIRFTAGVLIGSITTASGIWVVSHLMPADVAMVIESPYLLRLEEQNSEMRWERWRLLGELVEMRDRIAPHPRMKRTAPLGDDPSDLIPPQNVPTTPLKPSFVEE